MVDFRVMTHEDKDFFMQLMDMVGWGMTVEDYERMLHLSPDCLFLASIDGVDLGMVAATNYGELAWIGNLVVLPETRGKGIGAALMNKTIGYLSEKGVESIRLDGVQLAVPLYRRLGFKDEYWSLRYTGVATQHDAPETHPMMLDNLDEVIDFDTMVFNASRRDAIQYNYNRYPNLAFTAWGENGLIGYIMAKRGKTNIKIGPWVCKPGNPEIAEGLLRSVMNQVVGEDMWVGIPEENLDGVRILEKNGFEPLPSSLRMCYGDCSKVEDVKAVYGLGGPDKG